MHAQPAPAPLTSHLQCDPADERQTLMFIYVAQICRLAFGKMLSQCIISSSMLGIFSLGHSQWRSQPQGGQQRLSTPPQPPDRAAG